jgi:hypothetical protein
MGAMIMECEDSSLLRLGAPQQDLHLDIASSRVDRTDDTTDHTPLRASYPHVDFVAIS